MRSPADMDILVIDLTNRCFLKCSNCTRDIAHQTSTREMTPETFLAALESLKPWWREGRVIGLIGGEPTLNRHFAEICRIFRDEFNPGKLKHGRKPIENFNQFAHERLFDRRNGKGLWTSFGPKFTDHHELIMETFSHWNANDHSQGGKHQTSLVDAKEMCAALGIPWEEWPTYRDNCWLQNTWSACITPRGKAYFCERAGQLDELYNAGRLGWDVAKEPDWWKRTPDQFGEQLSICEMCSMALPGPSQVDSLDTDIIGEQHRIRLELIGSPAVKGGRFEQFDADKHCERRTIKTRDNYIAESCVRVSMENEYVKPCKVTAIVVCVDRLEQLAQTWYCNSKVVDELIIVTDAVARQWTALGQDAASIRFVTSTRCFDDNHAFNKGKMINDALATITHPDWILFTDADVFLNPNLKEYLKSHVLNPGVLYGTNRDNVQLIEDRWEQVPNGSYINREPNGYFQLFNVRAHAIQGRWPKLMCEEFCSAGGIDSWLLQQWPRDKRVQIPELAVRHIAHAEPHGQRWNGSRRGWRQCGMLMPNGMINVEPMPPGPVRMKLTDTLHGNTTEIDVGDDRRIDPDIIRVDGQGLVFMGKQIGWHHIHVAYWAEPEPTVPYGTVDGTVTYNPGEPPGSPGLREGVFSESDAES